MSSYTESGRILGGFRFRRARKQGNLARTKIGKGLHLGPWIIPYISLHRSA